MALFDVRWEKKSEGLSGRRGGIFALAGRGWIQTSCGMALTGKQRIAAFVVGVVLGGVLAAGVMSHRRPPAQPVVLGPDGERRAVPGVLGQWVSNGQPIEGDFVVSQMFTPRAADGTRLRAVVVPGLDAGSFVRVEETWMPQNPPVVRGWKFMFADRVRAQLLPGVDTAPFAEAVRAKGWRFTGRDPATGWVTLALGTHEAKSVPEALGQLQAWPQWVAAEAPDYLPGPATNGP